MKQTIELLRIEPDESVQDKMKRMLPAVTFSGEFTARNAKALETHTGLYVYDLDGVRPGRMKKMIKDERSLVMAFASPRGNGLKVVLRGPIAEDAETHRKFWEIGAALVEGQTCEKIDRSGSDVCRLCFLSSDPSMIEGKGIEFEEGKTVDDDVMAGVPEPKADFSGYTSHVVREMLWTIGSELPYDKWRNIIWSVVSHFGKHDWVREMLVQWSKETGGEKAMKDETAFEAIYGAKGKGITLASLIQLAKKAGWIDWRKQMRRDEEGELLHDDANLRVILENHPDFKGRVWMDSITQMQSMSPRDKVVSCTISKDGGPIEEHVAFDVLCDIQRNLGLGFKGTRTVLTALVAISKQNVRNLRKEWIEGLTWDGVPRIGRLFIDGFGAEDVERNEALATAFMAGAAARVLKPGASVQVMPILVGPQGCGKSSGIAALCPERDWFCDSFIDFESKAGYEVVLRATIVELSEMSAIKKADMEKVKQFVTQQSVRFRAPYEKQTQDHDATWVFIGTTNEEEFLKDTSGNRRFAPIKIYNARVEQVVKWIETNRDQLWAEAAVLAKRGLKEGKDMWNVPKKFWDELMLIAERSREKDPWEDPLREYSEAMIRKHGTIDKTIHDIALESGVVMRNRSDELHMGKMLRFVGWQRVIVNINGKTARRWRIKPVG